MKDCTTPGPWTSIGCTVIGGTDGTPIATFRQAKPRNTVEAMDNARLAAAAPDLLAACKAALGKIGAPITHRQDVLRMLKAAIAKAEGTL